MLMAAGLQHQIVGGADRGSLPGTATVVRSWRSGARSRGAPRNRLTLNPLRGQVVARRSSDAARRRAPPAPRLGDVS